MRSLFIQKLQENKKIKLEILIKREEKIANLKQQDFYINTNIILKLKE